MDSTLRPRFHRRRRSRPCGSLRQGLLGLLIAAGAAALQPAPLQAQGMGAIVRAFCLSAFENEMSQAGKTAPQGMANYACGCVEERILGGSSIEAARRECRQATARRYPI